MTRAFAILSVAVIASCAAEHSHQSLMQRHIDARGGRAVLENLKVVERKGSFTFHGMSPEAKGTYHTCLRYPDRVVVDIDAGPVQVHQVLGDNGAFECDKTFTQCAPAHPGVAEDLKDTARTANREELDEAVPAGAPVELFHERSQPVGYRYKKEDRVVEVEFAPDTGLERRVKNGSRERLYGGWKDAGGVLIPMEITDLNEGSKTVSIVLTEARHSSTPSQWCLERFAARTSGAQQAVPGDGPRATRSARP